MKVIKKKKIKVPNNNMNIMAFKIIWNKLNFILIVLMNY